MGRKIKRLIAPDTPVVATKKMKATKSGSKPYKPSKPMLNVQATKSTATYDTLLASSSSAQSTVASNSKSSISIFDLFDKVDKRNTANNEKDAAEQVDYKWTVDRQEDIISRPRNVRYEYLLERTFDNANNFQEFIDNENCWKVHNVPLAQKDGLKTIYWCTRVKCRGPRCLAQIYTIRDRFLGDTEIRLYRRNQEHTCETAENKVILLSNEMKKSIEKYVGIKMTPKPMIQHLRIDLPHDPATNKQIISYYKKYRKELFGKAKISVKDLLNFCEQNHKFPNEMDEAFILAYEHSRINDNEEEANNKHIDIKIAFDADEKSFEENQFEEPWIRFIVTTKRLLLNSSKSLNICADATKKVIVQKYPVLVFGATDRDSTQRFHLLAVMVSKHKTEADFEFGFRAIRNGIRRVSNEEFAPKILMRDASFAIHNAFIKVFGTDTTSLMCYAHVARAVDRRPIPTGVDKNEIKKDLSTLRLSYDKNTFDAGCRLFLAKWKNTAPNFADYFEKTWIRNNFNWYNGACHGMVRTNSGIENWNGNLKRYHTQWKMTGLNQFKIDLLGIIAKESRKYVQDKAPFKHDITISKRVMKGGYDLSKTRSMFRIKGEDGKGRCFIRKEGCTDELTTSFVNDFENVKYRTFEEFTTHLFDIYIVTFDMDVKLWKDTVTCTCPSFANYFICIHVMCMVYTLGLEEYKIDHQLVANNAPDRPKKETPALVID